MSGPQATHGAQYRRDAAGTLKPHRPTFHESYVKPQTARDRRARWPRLLDCIRVIVQRGDARYLDEADADEFVVIDLATREKAYCEWPPGASADILHGMIEGFFGEAAERIAEKVWCV